MKTGKQRFLKMAYPLLMKLTRIAGKNDTIRENKDLINGSSVYDLQVTLINGTIFPLEKLKGKKALLVNTASDCGYTAQYDELQKLQNEFGQSLEVIGFPSNDFKEQERKTDEEIEQFCKVSFGVSFLLAKKSIVIKNDHQNEIFKWLTHSDKNGWNNLAPEWNFSKYLINEAGVLTHYFGPSISPLDPAVLNAIKGYINKREKAF